VIDAGHGGTDNGAGSRFGNEKTYTLDTAGRLAKILNDAGLKTVFTRRTDVFVDLYERAHIASLYPDYCFVSIHYNSAMEEARGLETYCLAPRGAASTSSNYLTRGDIQKLPGNDYDTQNILLAAMVHSEIIRLNPGDATADRGVKRARFVVIKANTIPAILVEGGFVSNHMEAARVNRPDYRQQLAEAIARGVIRFVNAEGDRHMTLPDMGLSADAAAPVAKPVAPPAPTGLAHDSANGVVKPASNSTSTGATNAASATAPSHLSKKDKTKDKDKNKKAADEAKPAASAPATTSTPAPATVPADSSHAGTKSSGSALNLSEPMAPTPAPEADKAPPEPDEPPTVNAGQASSTNVPATSSATTNAAPTSSGTHEP
jgi:N-acetylmuramoyl-L-alanine amidase